MLEVTENFQTNVAALEFVKNVRFHWSVETMADFLENKLPHLDFHVDTLYYKGKTALELLVGDEKRHNSRDKSKMCLLLKHGASPLKKLKSGETIIQKVFRNKDSALIIEFLKYLEDINMMHGKHTALHIAVSRQLKDVVEYIVGRNADVNKKSCTGCTPFHESVRSNISVDITKILLESGADIDMTTARGQTPLHLAVEYNNINQVRILIMNGANVNATDSSGGTPLHTLCFRSSFDFELYELLLQNCNVNARDHEGVTTLHYLMRCLPIDAPTSEKIKLINLFLKYGANLHEPYGSLGTVLHSAAIFNQPLPFLTFLMDKMADMNIVDMGSITFMHCVSLRSGEPEFEEVLKFLSIRQCENKYKFYDNLLTFVKSDRRFIKFHKSCKNELRILKDRKLSANDSFSLFKALTTNEGDLAKIYRYDPSRITGITDFEMKRFPIYGNDLEKKHKYAIAILEAESQICDFLAKVSNNVLDQYSIYDIIKYIPTQEIVEVSVKLNSIMN